jgi:hypothetical protein
MSRPKPATVLHAVKPITAEIIVNTSTKRPTISFFLMPVCVYKRAPAAPLSDIAIAFSGFLQVRTGFLVMPSVFRAY